MEQNLVWEIVSANQEVPNIEYPVQQVQYWIIWHEAAESNHRPVTMILKVPLVSFPLPVDHPNIVFPLNVSTIVPHKFHTVCHAYYTSLQSENKM
jgi:hypothetical protein